MLYNNLSGYLRKKYGKRLKKICIDGGFSCPNRDGKCGTGGCIFCGEAGAGEHIDSSLEIRKQVENAMAIARADDEFIAYFQSFSNTYADVNTLKERYDAALISDRIRILAIGTRPDCIDEERARLIASYMPNREVWVELGLQSANDKTAKKIRRGYERKTFEEAVKILNRYNIPVIVHLIIGLPTETLEDIKSTTDYINCFKLFGVKIHSIYVMKNTELAKMYETGEYSPPTLEEFTEAAAYIVSHINPDVIIHRLTGDCPQGMLIAPEWNTDKHRTIRKIEEKLEKLGLKQGDLFH